MSLSRIFLFDEIHRCCERPPNYHAKRCNPLSLAQYISCPIIPVPNYTHRTNKATYTTHHTAPFLPLQPPRSPNPHAVIPYHTHPISPRPAVLGAFRVGPKLANSVRHGALCNHRCFIGTMKLDVIKMKSFSLNERIEVRLNTRIAFGRNPLEKSKEKVMQQ